MPTSGCEWIDAIVAAFLLKGIDDFGTYRHFMSKTSGSWSYAGNRREYKGDQRSPGSFSVRQMAPSTLAA
jgi:hypothetical protein